LSRKKKKLGNYIHFYCRRSVSFFLRLFYHLFIQKNKTNMYLIWSSEGEKRTFHFLIDCC